MGTGSLVISRKSIIASEGTVSASERIALSKGLEPNRLLEAQTKSPLFYKAHNTYITDTSHFNSMSHGYGIGTGVSDWDVVLREIREDMPTVWDTPKLKRLLSQPIGTPIDLTKEEAEEIVRLAAGRRPDLPSSTEFVKEVRELLGHSLMDRLKKSK